MDDIIAVKDEELVVVFLDIEMPELDGLGLLNATRTMESKAGTLELKKEDYFLAVVILPLG